MVFFSVIILVKVSFFIKNYKNFHFFLSHIMIYVLAIHLYLAHQQFAVVGGHFSYVKKLF